jgi:hypothetical protein
VRLPQVFGLMFEMVKVGVGRELSYRHDELPFVCPGPHSVGRKSVRKSQVVRARWTSSPFRGPDAPLCATERLARVGSRGTRVVCEWGWKGIPLVSTLEQRLESFICSGDL